MTSKTDITRKVRLNKKIKGGARRKAKLLQEGTTPKLFALNKPAAAEKAAKES